MWNGRLKWGKERMAPEEIVLSTELGRVLSRGLALALHRA